jgi:homocysteine S-methyltransferase
VDLILENYPTTKFWVSFQAKNESQIADGENFSEIAEKIWRKANNGNLLAVGLNCVSPKIVTPLFKSLQQGKSKNEEIPLMVWPNSGENFSTEKGWFATDLTPKNIEDYVPEWIDLGVKYLGLCCRTNLQDFLKIKEKLKEINS